MSDGISVDLGSVAPYIVESVLGLFGKDAESREWKNKITELVKLSGQQASTVQCVGMPEPIPISDIYQRTSLVTRSNNRRVEFTSLLTNKEDALIFAGPGWGKTTFLHWAYFTLCRDRRYIPLLFTLRWPNAASDLEDVIQQLQHGRDLARAKGTRLVLFVDGYDEISQQKRQKVSQALMLFASLGIGNFYMTCRSHYHVYDLRCRHLEVGPFLREDALKFVNAYSRAYGYEVQAEALLKELETHHLGEFYKHPLMLTLVCILKSGPDQQIPRRSIGLLRRAIDTLTFRWDEAKRVHRQSTIPLDGEERVRCLMRIAFDMNSPQEPWELVRESATAHVKLLQVPGINIRQLLEEMAQFYGLLVPAGAEYWQFVHRTIHDYLSARYWVESGKFNPERVAEWDIHAAYAACLTADATDAMILMLESKDLTAFMECLYNTAPFQQRPVANAIILRLAGLTDHKIGPLPKIAKTRRLGTDYSVQMQDDIYSLCTSEFLRVLLELAADMNAFPERSGFMQHPQGIQEASQAVAVCAIRELHARNAKIRARHISLLKTVFDSSPPTSFSCLLGEHQYYFNLQDVESAATD